jgi:hypothetical protein
MMLNDDDAHSVLPPAGPVVRLISGAKLARRLQHIPAAHRIRLAVDLAAERVRIHKLTVAQASRLVRVHPARVGKALGRPPRQRSDAEIDRMVARVGLDVVRRSLDRLTAPAMPADNNDTAATIAEAAE